MAQRPASGAIGRELRTLWNVGAVGEVDDTGLLVRFSAGRDESAEAAFRVLVERHGPMVLRVCRQVLGDGHDAQDAAQAVFLVLARKAGSIRNRGSVAPWLYGVACRVAAKARRVAAVRRANEAHAARAVASGRGEPVAEGPPAPGDWDAIHEEVARLPEKYRAPVVLCYLEGQTYEETARRLGCPVGTVRVRLSRARDRLRDRLTRRGFGPAAAVPAAWTAEGPPVQAVSTVPSGWVESTARAAHAIVTGRASEAGVVSASALALGQEVLRSMMVSKLKLAALGLLATGAVVAGGNALVGQDSPARPAQSGVPPKPAATALDDRERELVRRVLDAARLRLEAQKAFYEEGRITVDRYVDASRQVRDAETYLATTRQDRVAAAKAHLDRVTEIAQREKAELTVGRGTKADVAEAQQAQELAELDVFDAQKSGGRHDYEALERRLDAVEKKLDRMIKLLSLLNPGDKEPPER
jgi:RNA polymerase sigma factor (sigma-70 family)